MPKPKMSASVEMRDLAAREEELAKRREMMFVQQAMVTHPNMVDVLGRKCRSHGLTPESVALALEKAPKDDDCTIRSARAKAQMKRLENLKLNTHAAAKTAMRAEEGKDWIHSKYVVLEDFSAEMLISMVLEVAEPRSLSAASMRSMRRERSDAMSKSFVLKLVDFVTGFGVQYKISGPLRYVPFFKEMVAWRSRVRGRRGQELRLPPIWPADGIFAHSVSDSIITVSHKFTKEKHTIDAAAAASFQELTSLTIEANHSEALATLTSGNSIQSGILLSSIFKGHVVDSGLKAPMPPPAALASPPIIVACAKKKPDGDKITQEKTSATKAKRGIELESSDDDSQEGLPTEQAVKRRMTRKTVNVLAERVST